MAHLRCPPLWLRARLRATRLRATERYEAMLRARLCVHRLRFRTENLLDSTPFLPFISIMYLMQ